MNSDRDLLYKSLDQKLTSEEEATLERALAESATLSAERKELLQMRTQLRNASVAPSQKFVDQVMKKVNPALNQSGATIVQLFPRVAAACMVGFLFMASAIYFSENEIVPDAIVGIDDLSVEEVTNLYLQD